MFGFKTSISIVANDSDVIQITILHMSHCIMTANYLKKSFHVISLKTNQLIWLPNFKNTFMSLLYYVILFFNIYFESTFVFVVFVIGFDQEF